MRRIPFPAAAMAVGLVALLTGCAGETPTSPSTNGGGGSGGTGTCTVSIAMLSTSLSPTVGTEVVVRASVTKGGAAVPDGTSVQMTTDLGVFAENGLPTVSKTTVSGAADITLFSQFSGAAHVKAAYDCGSSTLTINYSGASTLGPYVSSYSPTTGICTGGDTVTLLGGLFGTTPGIVYFGGAPASLVSWATNTITVKTPVRTLKNSSIPEQVDVVVSAAGTTTTAPIKFTYFCIDPSQRMSVSSINPIAGSPGGGDAVVILGSHFGLNISTTQVTFCGLPAQITGQSDTQISVSTPAHTLANPALSEACPVVVTRDLGLVSTQNATSPVPFTYRGSGSTGACNADPGFFVTSLRPTSGSPDGGDVVTITGSGFPTNATLLRVDFGGSPGTIVGSPTTTTFQVSTPRRVLATPDVPETVDVVVTDLGSATQRCARVGGAFVYTAKALDPAIYGNSPVTGPNDQSTRVTLFGTNFQFPMQVFMTGGTSCGAQRVEAAQPIQVSPTQIIFNTPVANGGNACLAGQLVDIVIVNPSTGKTAKCTSCFKYYSCPVAGVASPSVGSTTQPTTVVVSGNNFPEPTIANFRLASSGTPLTSLQVTSVSNTSIIVTLPSLQTLLGGSLSCGNTDGFIDLTFPGITCVPNTISVPFAYHSDPPTASTASPNNLSQDGSAYPATGSPATITLLGTNFQAPMTVTLIKDGVPVPNTPINNASVSNPTALTFAAPAVPNNSLNQQNCSSGGPINGLKYVPTSFGIRVRNTLTGCSVDLPNVLVYYPIDTTCRAALQIVTPSLPNGTAGAAYSAQFIASGGAGAPYSWSAVGLPAALVLNAGTGVISGTPAAAGTSTINVTVVDAAANTSTRIYTLQVN
ncbi:MAG TPA: IPT/TIG domain-containing protein [Thermoanaerobaculia bacterium]|nr:IPT/TIG domain-containing protein [Thermoanaerobaculia bacterium]